MTVFESLLNNDFVVERRRRSPDGQGGWSIDYVGVGTVRGRIRPTASRNQEREVADRDERRITHVLYVAVGLNIVRGDRVVLNDLMVDVEAIREPSKGGEHWEIECIEVQREESLPEVGS